MHGMRPEHLATFILLRPTQARNSGRAEHCLVVLSQWRWRGYPKTKRQVAEASEEWVKVRLMDLADSPYSTTSQKISALEFLGKTLGLF